MHCTVNSLKWCQILKENIYKNVRCKKQTCIRARIWWSCVLEEDEIGFNLDPTICIICETVLRPDVSNPAFHLCMIGAHN